MVCMSLLGPQGHGQGERHRLGLAGEDVVVGVDQFDPHLVLTDRQPGDVKCIGGAGVRPPPRQVVHGDVQMPNARKGSVSDVLLVF